MNDVLAWLGIDRSRITRIYNSCEEVLTALDLGGVLKDRSADVRARFISYGQKETVSLTDAFIRAIHNTARHIIITEYPHLKFDSCIMADLMLCTFACDKGNLGELINDLEKARPGTVHAVLSSGVYEVADQQAILSCVASDEKAFVKLLDKHTADPNIPGSGDKLKVAVEDFLNGLDGRGL